MIPSSPRLRRGAILGLLLAAMIGSSGRDPGACGPFLPVAVFTYALHPDFPLDAFARGQLGVLQPTYARSYLTVAYRQMSGLPIADAETGAIVALWKQRLYGDGLPPTSQGGLQAWREARRRVIAGDGPSAYAKERKVPGADYQWYPNIHDAAFRQAAETLDARVKTFGKESPIVRAWIDAQDLVFTTDTTFPAALTPLPATAPALARADRQYQIAAAHFYAGEFAPAREAFQAIAQDEASPWRAWGGYLAARCLLRQATVDPMPPADATRLLTKASQEFEAIAADNTAPAALRESSRGLLPRAGFWHDALLVDAGDSSALVAAGDAVLAATPGASFGTALDRFTRLLDRPALASTPVAKSLASSKARTGADLIAWLDIVQRGNADRYSSDVKQQARVRGGAAEDALAHWRQTQSLPWLVATLLYASSSPVGDSSLTDADITALLSAAAAAPANSPAYATLAFHRARILLERRDRPSARTVLDAAIGQGDQTKFPRSALNQLHVLRRRTARTRDEFFADAATPIITTGLNDDGQQTAPPAPDGTPFRSEREIAGAEETSFFADRVNGTRLFDADAAELVNRLPVEEIVAAAESTSLPTPLRRDLALAAWTRALRLEDHEQGLRAAPLVRQFAPVLAADVDAYVAARDPIDIQIAGTWALLRFPGLSGFVEPGLGRLVAVQNRDIFRNNWWCEGTEVARERFLQAPGALLGDEPERPAYLSDAQAAQAVRELFRLRPAGGTSLPLAVVRWAKQRPADPRLPEALHRAVQATRYGCTDGDTGAASKAAFDLLHTRFPTSTWAKQTKYWYK